MKSAAFYFSVLAFLLIVYLYLYSLSKSATSEEEEILVSFSELVNNQSETNETSSNFDESCDLYGEWERISNLVFFKRTAVYYFIDAELLTIHMLKRPSNDFNFTLHIEVYENLDDFTSNQIASFYSDSNDLKTRQQSNFSRYLEYDYSVLSLSITPTRLNISASSPNIKMYVRVADRSIMRETKRHLLVKIKHLANPLDSKKSSMICTKCYAMKKSEDYLSFRWWLELNRQIGYEKISVCNQSIENAPEFHDLVKKNSDFFELRPLKCIPNLQNKAVYGPEPGNMSVSIYYDSFSSLKTSKTGTLSLRRVEVVNLIAYNECYLDHVDEFKYIAVIDIDETILPRQLENFVTLPQVSNYLMNQTLNLNQSYPVCVQGENLVENFINNLVLEHRLKPAKSMHSKFGFYLENDLIEKTFESLKNVLPYLRSIQNDSEPIDHVVYPIGEEFVASNWFSLTIKSRAEVQYASKLHAIYTNMVKPFFDKNKEGLANNVAQFDRLFFVAGYC
jgi:hypothetical protein